MPVIRMTRPPGYKRASIFLDLHGQRTETVDETGVDALGLARDLHAHPPRRHFLEQNAQLQLGEARADAAVNAVAEGQVAAGILAVTFQGVAIVEHALVAVRRKLTEDELVDRQGVGRGKSA